MIPTNIFIDPQLAVRHQEDLRISAARARFARVATRTFAIERLEAPSARRWALRFALEANRG
jgi:hypothetical protein